MTIRLVLFIFSGWSLHPDCHQIVLLKLYTQFNNSNSHVAMCTQKEDANQTLNRCVNISINLYSDYTKHCNLWCAQQIDELMNVTARLCIPTTAHSAHKMYNVTTTIREREILNRELKNRQRKKKKNYSQKHWKKGLTAELTLSILNLSLEVFARARTVHTSHNENPYLSQTVSM